MEIPEYYIELDIKSFQSYNLDQKLHELQFGNRFFWTWDANENEVPKIP